MIVEVHKYSKHELEILRLLARGEKEIEAGKGYALDAVITEADSLLEELTSGSTRKMIK